jgi:predicted transcriptional regulator
MKDKKVNEKEYKVISLLEKNYMMKVEAIAKELKTSRIEVIRLLKNLEKKGYVEINKEGNTDFSKAIAKISKIKSIKDKYNNMYI